MTVHTGSLLDRDDPAAQRFWALLISMTSGFAARAGVPLVELGHGTPAPVPQVPRPRDGRS
ncbi:hypothetical protein H7X46_18585 [Pseudonocardia sp. C8]|uniref:hypothetical protein n=1 Tax=Pseudonocardia sp. C8 TaxID=2762759 RepID=UPI001642E80E|nr:hypothetical protein [Pseudonocardia sp. C8]